MRIENETRGAHAGAATAMVTDSLTPMSSPGEERADRVGEAPDDDHGEDHAEPRPHLRWRERRDEGDVAPRHAAYAAATPDSRNRLRPVVHAEGGGDGGILGARAQRLADVREAEPRPRPEGERRRRQAGEELERGHVEGPHPEGVARPGRLVAAEVRRPVPLDERLDDHSDARR